MIQGFGLFLGLRNKKRAAAGGAASGDRLITEASDTLITEASDQLITE